jgi:hypothetical protein
LTEAGTSLALDGSLNVLPTLAVLDANPLELSVCISLLDPCPQLKLVTSVASMTEPQGFGQSPFKLCAAVEYKKHGASPDFVHLLPSEFFT